VKRRILVMALSVVLALVVVFANGRWRGRARLDGVRAGGETGRPVTHTPGTKQW
jgi:hypothetical protein